MKGGASLAAMLRPKLRLQEEPTPLVACPCPFPSASPVVEAVLAVAAVGLLALRACGDAVAAGGCCCCAVAAAVVAVGAPAEVAAAVAAVAVPRL